MVMILVDLVTGGLPLWAAFLGEYLYVDDWYWNVKWSNHYRIINACMMFPLS